MFESILTTTDTTIQAGQALLCLAAALILGIGIAAAYILAERNSRPHKDFIVAVALLPVIVSVVIMLVGSNIARAFSLAGAFALVRFRSAPGSGKDIAIVFFSMAVGLACGLGYIIFAVVVAVIIAAAFIILCKTPFGAKKGKEKLLKITIPEDLNYNGVFDDLFATYTNSCRMKNVKTTNMGSLYELAYIVDVKDEALEKEFIDAIRCRNGNLNISLGLISEKSEIL